MSDNGDMTVKQHPDGTVEVLNADDEITVAAEFIDAPDLVGDAFTFDGDVLTVTAENGTYRYRVHGLDEIRQHYRATRLREDARP